MKVDGQCGWCEPLAVAGALAAARRNVPALVHGTSLFDESELVRVTSARLTGALRRHRVDALPPSTTTLTIAPMSVVGVRPGVPMRAVPYGGEGTLPDWLRKPSDRPRILVSRSTVVGPGAGDLMGAVVVAAAGIDAEVVLVRPHQRLARRGALPANVRSVQWIPLPLALPVSTAIVHHGGAGTALAALAAGIPQLIVPGAGDRRHNGELIAARHAGLAVAARDITAERLHQLVTDPALAQAAAEVREEMNTMPGPADVVTKLF